MLDDTLEAFHLALAEDAAEGLRDQCEVTRDRISEGASASYTATSELDTSEYFVIDDDETLAELAAFRGVADNLGAIPQIAPADLDLSVKLYAVTIGDGSDRTIFVRRANPQLQHKAGRFFAIGRERL